jgi:hypothetical protein
MSPTELTLRQLRAEGYTARVVEQTVHAAGRVFKRDCFGFDVLAVRPPSVVFPFGPGTPGGQIGVQACAAASHAARKTKILANPEAAVWVASGARLEIWSWSTRRSLERTKAGKRSKRLVHHLRREEITLAMFVPQQAFSEALEKQEEQPREAMT